MRVGDLSMAYDGSNISVYKWTRNHDDTWYDTELSLTSSWDMEVGSFKVDGRGVLIVSVYQR